MKTIYTAIITLLVSNITSAQTIQKSIVNSTGESVTFNKITIHTSVGDPIVYSAPSASGVTISQGFFSGNQKRNVSKIEEAKVEETASVYPNPFSNQITVKLSSPENAKIEIYNALGEKVYAADYSQDVIQLNDLAAGLYSLRATQKDNQVSVSKILKQ